MLIGEIIESLMDKAEASLKCKAAFHGREKNEARWKAWQPEGNEGHWLVIPPLTQIDVSQSYGSEEGSLTPKSINLDSLLPPIKLYLVLSKLDRLTLLHSSPNLHFCP